MNRPTWVLTSRGRVLPADARLGAGEVVTFTVREGDERWTRTRSVPARTSDPGPERTARFANVEA